MISEARVIIQKQIISIDPGHALPYTLQIGFRLLIEILNNTVHGFIVQEALIQRRPDDITDSIGILDIVNRTGRVTVRYHVGDQCTEIGTVVLIVCPGSKLGRIGVPGLKCRNTATLFRQLQAGLGVDQVLQEVAAVLPV